MPLYEAPNHPDCKIECPGPGSADYVAPDGPCVTTCGPQDTANRFFQILTDHGEEVRFDLRVNLDSVTLKNLINLFSAEKLEDKELMSLIKEIARKIKMGLLPEGYELNLSLGYCDFKLLFAEINASFGQTLQA